MCVLLIMLYDSFICRASACTQTPNSRLCLNCNGVSYLFFLLNHMLISLHMQIKRKPLPKKRDTEPWMTSERAYQNSDTSRKRYLKRSPRSECQLLLEKNSHECHSFLRTIRSWNRLFCSFGARVLICLSLNVQCMKFIL